MQRRKARPPALPDPRWAAPTGDPTAVALAVDRAAVRIDGDEIHRRLGNGWWPPRWATLNGVHLDERGDRARVRRIIVSLDRDIAGREHSAGVPWIHASISRTDTMPTYADLTLLHRVVFGSNAWAYQVFAPAAAHVNLHDFALHLWGRWDGLPVLPDLTHRGEI